MDRAGKPITCRAAVCWEVNQPFSIETVEVAVPKKGEVRVRMCSTGVCHSDLHIKDGINKDWVFPAILGHEGAGLIESVGEGVTSVKPGDTVVLVFEAYCGECKSCKEPRTNMCDRQPRDNLQRDGTTRITCNGKDLTQMSCISTFSEYTVTSELNVTKVSSKANPNTLCLAGCCIPTGYGAVMKAGQVPPGSTCAVWGLGGVGMCVLMGCRDSGASKIIGIDTNPRKFELAKKFGATEFVNPKEVSSVPEKLAELTNGGVDYCFVSVGIIPAMEEAFNSSHPQWGKTVIIGLSDIGDTMRAGVWELLYGRQLVGTFYGSYKARVEIPHLVDKVLEGQIQLNDLISHRLPLEKINEGFNMLKTGESTMPPKKDKKKQEPLVVYDINTMNTADLREYARTLEKEIEATRDFCSFYRQTEDEFASVYRTRQDHIQQMDDEIVNKDIEVEKLRLEVQQKTEEKEQKTKYNDFVSSERKKVQASMSRLNEGLPLDHCDQEDLGTRLQDEEMEFEAERRGIQMARKDAMEKNSKKLKDVEEFEENLWKMSLKVFKEKLEEAGQQNKLAQSSIEAEALEAKRSGENHFRDVCQSYKQRLQDYYKSITRKDLDVVKELDQKAEDMKASIESTKLQIKEAHQQTEDTKAGEKKKSSDSFAAFHAVFEQKTSNTTNSNKNKKMELLKKENQVLEGKIKVLEEQTTNLRDQFTQVLHKVRQSAEMRALLLEKKLNSSLSDSDDENSVRFVSENVRKSNEPGYTDNSDED